MKKKRFLRELSKNPKRKDMNVTRVAVSEAVVVAAEVSVEAEADAAVSVEAAAALVVRTEVPDGTRTRMKSITAAVMRKQRKRKLSRLSVPTTRERT